MQGTLVEKHVLDTIDPAVIGERLSDARRARRMTQQEAAAELGVARTTLTAMENGTRRPRAAELLALARLYGRQVGDFVHPSREKSEPNFVIQFRAARGPADTLAADEREADTQRFGDFCRWYVELEEMLGAPLPRRYPESYRTTNA